jgi:hypothetical protein
MYLPHLIFHRLCGCISFLRRQACLVSPFLPLFAIDIVRFDICNMSFFKDFFAQTIFPRSFSVGAIFLLTN